MDAISYAGFSQIDFVLLPRRWLQKVTTIYSDRSCAIPSRHFPVFIEIEMEVEQIARPLRVHRFSVSALTQPAIAHEFSRNFASTFWRNAPGADASLDELTDVVTAALSEAASQSLPQARAPAQRP